MHKHQEQAKVPAAASQARHLTAANRRCHRHRNRSPLLQLAVSSITSSLVLVADVSYIMSNIVGYIVALVAVKYANKSSDSSQQYTYRFRRAEMLGGFLNGGR
jgi:hypothetical protein